MKKWQPKAIQSSHGSPWAVDRSRKSSLLQFNYDIFTKNKYYIHSMHQYHNLNEGTYLVQSGFRNDTAIISCPYVSHKIEVYDAHSLKIFHGASVFWTEIRRQYPSRRKGNREVISAVVVAIKHCEYLCEGKNVLCTLKISKGMTEGWLIEGFPINTKLPKFRVESSPEIEQINFQDDAVRKAYQQRYYWARFTSWNYDESYPKGTITGLFSQSFKTPQVQTEAILYNMDIFQNECHLFNRSLIPANQEYLPIKNHREFNQMVFTIDPPGSLDIEDGLSLQELPNGLFEVGIHISDVTSFRHLMNRKQVAQRGTSIYLPHKTIHMMPQEIMNLCALKSKKRRLAFSVLFKVDAQGNILDSRFEKTVVKSIAQLTYDDAQSMINENEDSEGEMMKKEEMMKKKELTEREYQGLSRRIRLLKSIAFSRRKDRFNADFFDKNEIVFELDEKNFPINIGLKKRVESEKLVEEFMIMANYAVAKKLVQDFGVHSLIIYHPKPSQYNIEHLNDYVSDFGIKFKADNLNVLKEEIQSLFDKEEITDELKQLLLLKAVQIQEFAVYTCYLNTYKGHYGLNLDYYTHFTSPVRRFADLIVHEQLEKCINGEKLSQRQIAKLGEEIELINKARIKSKKLKQLVVECFMNLFMYHSGEKIKTKGFIISLGLKSATIYVPHYNIIKEVVWTCPTSYLDKDIIEVTLQARGSKIIKEFHKNDSIDIEIYSEIHQEVKLNLIVKDGDEKIII